MKRILIIWALLISVCFAQSKAGFYVVGGKIITVQDTSSRKYLKAIEDAGVVPSTVQNFASNYLVTTERAIGTYTLIKAQYPFIGGTAATHKFNLNDPRDLDAAFRLVFVGGVTHSANGIQGDGSTGYVNTNYIPNVTNFNVNNNHISFYSRTNNSENSIEIGCYDVANQNQSAFRISTFYGGLSSAVFDDGGVTNRIVTAGYNSRGYFIGTRISTSQKLFRDGLLIGQRTASGGGNFNSAVTLFGFNAAAIPSISFYSSKQSPYASIGLVFTDAQSIQQSKIVTSFEGFLGRQ